MAVVRSVQRLLPKEDVLLLCDDAYAPYARRRPDVVVRRVAELLAQSARRRREADRDRLAAGGARRAALQPPGRIALIGLEAPIPQAGAACDGGAVAAVVAAGMVRGRLFGQALRRQRGASAIHVEEWPPDGASVAARVPALIAAGVGALALTSPGLAQSAPGDRRGLGWSARDRRCGRRRCRAGRAHAPPRGPAGAPSAPRAGCSRSRATRAARSGRSARAPWRLVGQRLAREQRPELAQPAARRDLAASARRAAPRGRTARHARSQPRDALAGGARLVGLAQRHEREEGDEQRRRQARAARATPCCGARARARESPDDAPCGVVHDRVGHVQAAVAGERGAQVEVDVLPREREAPRRTARCRRTASAGRARRPAHAPKTMRGSSKRGPSGSCEPAVVATAAAHVEASRRRR